MEGPTMLPNTSRGRLSFSLSGFRPFRPLTLSNAFGPPPLERQGGETPYFCSLECICFLAFVLIGLRPGLKESLCPDP